MIDDPYVDDSLFEFMVASAGTALIKCGAICRSRASPTIYDDAVAVLVPMGLVNDLNVFLKSKGVRGEIRVAHLKKAH